MDHDSTQQQHDIRNFFSRAPSSKVSTKMKTKRALPDVTNDATTEAKKKKTLKKEADQEQAQKNEASPKQTQEKKSWEANSGLFCDLTTLLAWQPKINDDSAFYKTVFDHIYKTSGEEAIKALCEPYARKIAAASETNQRMVGNWRLSDGGLIEIGPEVDSVEIATFSNSSVRVDAFWMKEPKCDTFSNVLEYSGESLRWEDCQNPYKAEMTLEYDAINDTIKGTIEVTPHQFAYVTDDEVLDGGVIEFTATREGDDYDNNESDGDY